MSEALRFNENKMNWIILDGYFRDAQEAEYLCREYGVEKYTNDELGTDGLTNWMESMGTEKHNEFMYGCLESANRHLLDSGEASSLIKRVRSLTSGSCA